MKHIFVLAFLFISACSFLQTNIELRDVSKHIGDSISVEGVVFGGKYFDGSKGSPTFLNIGGKYSDALLTLVIWEDVRNKFTHQPIEKFYDGNRIIINGVIKTYKDKPEIVISNPNQIQEIIKVDVK